MASHQQRVLSALADPLTGGQCEVLWPAGPRRLTVPAAFRYTLGMASATTRNKRALPKAKRRPRTSLTPRKTRRGLTAAEIVLGPDAAELGVLAGQVRAAGGVAVAGYREPLSGRPLLFASLPLAAVRPTPFQRDLSPTHVKRLASKIEEAGTFLDPVIVVRGEDGKLWTPNGRHRLAAAKILGLRQVMAIVSPDEDLAFRILALNTEKPHNLRDRSLEVIRMARNLARLRPRARESEFSAEFESPELLILGIVYERNSRFAGSAYGPLLRRLDRFSDRRLSASIRGREGIAARLEAIDADVRRIIDGLQERGFRSPYLRNYVVARINPLSAVPWKKRDAAVPIPLPAALTRMAAAARNFDLGSVKRGELALMAAVMTGEN